jgi:FixJ family two-component response regulator
VAPARVLVVDDETHMRAALQRVFALAGYEVELYESGKTLLERADLSRPGCILLDMLMPGMNGLDVQRALIARECLLPLVFLTGSADVPNAVAAMRAGAFDFLEKPFDNADLLQRVEHALDACQRKRAAHQGAQEIAERVARLSPRETEVIGKIALGLTNKEIARELGTSHRTVEIQRAHIMQRMQASSLAELIRMYLLVHPDPPG